MFALLFAFKPLLAVDWVEILIFLFIVTSSLVGQLFKAAQQRSKKGAAAKGQRKGPPAMGKQPGGQPVAGPPGQGAPAAGRPKTSLEKEIEAFLRKSLGQPAAEEPKAPPLPQQRPSRPSAPPQRRPAKKPRPATSQDFPRTESVGQHVRRHLQTGGIAQRDAHLGDALGHADERLESHLHGVFDHQVGSLTRQSGRAGMSVAEGTDAGVWQHDAEMNPLSDQLFQMLSTPQQVRTALVLAEVLRRPEERWS